MDAIVRSEVKPLFRSSALAMELPPRQLVVLEITQRKPYPFDWNRPDLAVTCDDAEADIGAKRLTVKLHNIGNAAAANVVVRVIGQEGGVVAERVVGKLDAPLDLTSRTASVEFEGAVALGRSVRVVVDPDNRVDEINELNNEIVLRVRDDAQE